MKMLDGFFTGSDPLFVLPILSPSPNSLSSSLSSSSSIFATLSVSRFGLKKDVEFLGRRWWVASAFQSTYDISETISIAECCVVLSLWVTVLPLRWGVFLAPSFLLCEFFVLFSYTWWINEWILVEWRVGFLLNWILRLLGLKINKYNEGVYI